MRSDASSSFVLSDDNKKFVGVTNPDGTVSEFGGVSLPSEYPKKNAPFQRNGFSYKHFHTAGYLLNSVWFYVPIANKKFAYYCIISPTAANTSPMLVKIGIAAMANFVHHGDAGVVKTGTFVTTPQVAYSRKGSVTYSQTAGDTCTFTGIGHTLVANQFQTTNGGFFIVAVDGDYTAANRLPKFTATDYSNGVCRESDIGKAYINTFAGTIYGDLNFVIADGLADTAHTVTYEITGTKMAGSSAVRAYFCGVGFVSDSTTQSPIENVVIPMPVEPVLDTISGSAMMFTLEIERNSGGGVYDFCGEVHGYEQSESIAIYNGSTNITALAAGTYSIGIAFKALLQSVVGTQDAPTTSVLRKRLNYMFSADNSYPAMCSYDVTWLVAKNVRSVYPAMLPIASLGNLSPVVENTRWNVASFGGYVSSPENFSSNNDGQNGGVQAYTLNLSSTLHSNSAYVTAMTTETVDGFINASPNNCFLQDRSSDKLDKLYITKNSNVSPRFVGQVEKGLVAWGVY